MATASSSASLVLPAQPPPTERSRSLDGLRGLACLAVYSVHTGFSIRLFPFVFLGWTGVHLFFVLSGYLIGKPFLLAVMHRAPRPDLRKYGLRRFLRIYPPYAFSIAVFLLLRWATGNKLPDKTNLFSHVLLFFNYIRSVEFLSINGVYWSLAIEAQFYLLLPFLAFLVPFLPIRDGFRTAWSLVCLLILGGVFCRLAEVRWNGWLFPGNTPIRFRTVFSYLDLFGFGMATALLESSRIVRQFITPRRATVVVIAGALLFIMANDWCAASGGDWQTSKSDFFITLFPVMLCAGLAAMLVGILLGSPIRHAVAWRPLAWVGEISYSVYLYHLAVLVLFFRALPMPWLHGWYLRAATYSLIGLAPTLLASWLMFEMVERPSLKLVARFRG